jgi:hypothetical protein
MRLFFFFLAICASAADPPPIRVLHDDGGWCWFEDERAVVVRGKLIFGVVASQRKGNVEAVAYDLAKATSTVTVLHAPANEIETKRWMDDHNSPAFVLRPDGRLAATYAMHGVEEKIYYRITEPGDLTRWGDERVFVPSPSSRVTYSNLHYLSAEKRIYDFFRGLDNSFKPSYAWSEDMGETWKTGNVFINVPLKFRHRPYVKYASNGRDTVHIAYTDGHPRDFDNSIYHISYRSGSLHSSDGTRLNPLSEGLKAPEEGTLVFRGDPQNVAWISDLHLDAKGRPVLVFSVQKDSAGLPSAQAGLDLRYHYARWDGHQWRQSEIAYAGSKLYTGEDDYTGNIAIDPNDVSTVYISTNADPVSGKPLISSTDDQPHWEIYKGVTRDGARFTWTALTSNSVVDHIRPIAPTDNRHRIVMWLRGKMRSYTDYQFEVVGLIENRNR